MSGDEIDHAAHLWSQGRSTAEIASFLFVREALVFRNLAAIKRRARELADTGGRDDRSPE